MKLDLFQVDLTKSSTVRLLKISGNIVNLNQFELGKCMLTIAVFDLAAYAISLNLSNTHTCNTGDVIRYFIKFKKKLRTGLKISNETIVSK